jgi:hypothetical protein
MPTMMAIIIFLALAALAAAHVAWGFGAHWPAANRDDLFLLVVGATRRTEMPGLPQCLAAAAAIFCAGFSALLVADVVRPPLPAVLVTSLGALVALIFAGRGIASYTGAWRRRFSKEPFATMDRSCYGPFCLLLAAAFALLVIKRVTL